MQRMMRIDVKHSNGVVTEYYPAREGGAIADEYVKQGKRVMVYSGWIDWQPDMFHGDMERLHHLEEVLDTHGYDARDRARIEKQWGKR